METCHCGKDGLELWDWPCGSSDPICKECKQYRTKYYEKKAKQAIELRDFKREHNEVFKKLRRLEKALESNKGFR